jgi:hypothetical protein
MPEDIRVGSLELRFLRSKHDTAGGLDMFEMTCPPNANMPVPHYHRDWDETIYGLSGVVTWTVDGEVVKIGPGDKRQCHQVAATVPELAAADLVGEAPVNRNRSLIAAAEDFANMLEVCPGAFINIGNAGAVGSCPVHNPHYDFNDAALPIGASLLARLVEKKLARLSGS